jgi:predicted AlkP superfamily phosphohydrolase/phosphomutase
MTARTVLIGIDGGTFRILDPLMGDGVMPFLRDFAASGVRAELGSVMPPLTPPAWTSLVTGCSPGRHGIFDFFRKESPESHHIRFVSSHDVCAETIWSIAHRHSLRTTALNFPLMFPPPRIDGYVVPGWMPWRQLRLGCHPPGLYDRLKALPGFDARELAMDMDLEAKAVEGCKEDEYEEWIAYQIRREQQWFQILCTLVREEPCELTAVLFDGTDKLQHLFWRFLDPDCLDKSPGPGERRIRQHCRDYFRQLDQLLAEIARLAGPDATIVLASDHGFGPQTGTFFVNTWLAQHSYLAWADDKAPLASGPWQLGLDQLARHVYLLDWERTRAYTPTPSGNGIHIVPRTQPGEPGVPEDEYQAFRSRLVDELLGFVDLAVGEPVVAHVWTREEIFDGPCTSLAPDLTLELVDGGLVSILASDAPFKPRPEPTGTHRPEGILIARGPGLRQGVQLAPLSILDVAPLLLYSLGLPIPADLEGRVPVEALEPAALRARPVEAAVPQAPAAEEPSGPQTGPVLDKEAEAELLKRLRALGYVE